MFILTLLFVLMWNTRTLEVCPSIIGTPAIFEWPCCIQLILKPVRHNYISHLESLEPWYKKIDLYFVFEIFNSPVIHKKLQYQSSLLFISTRTLSPFCQGDPWINNVPGSCLALRLDKNGNTGTKAEGQAVSVFSRISPQIQGPLTLHTNFL